MIKNKKIAIIGAGMSGLTLANNLSKTNKIDIFDKSRGIGGRMATRRNDDYHFDHGAQYFTTKTKEFSDFCQNMMTNDIIDIWSAKYVEINNYQMSDAKNISKTYPYFISKPQMNNLCKYLAKDFNMILKSEIKKMEFLNHKWILATDDYEYKDYDYLFITIPSDQAVNLLPEDFKYYDLVKNIKMLACYTLMLGFKDKLNIPFEAARINNSPLEWIAVNNSKSLRPDVCAITINSSNLWAKKNLDHDIGQVKEIMLNELAKIITFSKSDLEVNNIHRWRYANAENRDDKHTKSLFDEKLKLGISGDWLIGGRVENAYLSALDLARKLG
jgi:renalase